MTGEEKTRNTEKIRNTVGYYLLFLCLGFAVGITGPALPSLAGQTNSTIGQIGILLLFGSFSSTATWYPRSASFLS